MATRGLCAITQVESLGYKLIDGLAVRRLVSEKYPKSFILIEFMIFVRLRACYSVLRFIMESGAKGCEVVVSGKLRGQRVVRLKEPNSAIQRALKIIQNDITPTYYRVFLCIL